MRLILVATLCLAAAACSRGDENRTRADVRDAGHDVANAARDVKNDPTVKQVGADARAATHDAAVAVRKGAAEAEVKTGQALVDAGDKAKRAAAQARADSDGPSRN
jgi:hypothetical protein